VKPAILAPDERLPRRTELVPPWPGRAEVVDGAVTFVRDTPATAPGAEPALYVHGLGGSSQNWTDLADLLSHRLAGQAIDLPGFGRSDPALRYTVRALADRVVRWIQYADRGPVHLFGNSLGGAIAVRVAAARPDLVRTLTLVSPALPFLDPRRSVQARYLPLLAVPRAERLAARRLARMTPEALTRMVVQACFADPERVPLQRLAEAEEEARLRTTLPHHSVAYVRTMRGLLATFLRAYLPGSSSLWRIVGNVTVPTLVVAGRRDQLVDVRVATRTAKTIPDSRLLLLDGVGHVAQMEVPRVVARVVLALLDEAGGASADGTHGVNVAG
jgi:pimeloyl-ACP methyl ester carboxylesterase